MQKYIFTVISMFLAYDCCANEEASCETHDDQKTASLCSYEPNIIGYTWDSDDVGFLDFSLSVRYQMFPKWITEGVNYLHEGLGQDSAVYFSFSGRFGQYIGTRDSSPVVGKRFNPTFFSDIGLMKSARNI